jgi:DNA polymerase-3 subunit epsilon
MKDKIYAIIDIETTGGRARRDKITEIAIVLHDGVEIIDTYETLVNPECHIPYGITELTGISQEMVADAPKFYEVARKVVEMTENCVFVAHNVRFDYGFIREEFKRLGFSYVRKQLCTVRLSRKTIPGLGSYGLSNLIRFMGIEVDNRHRAMGDAIATAELFRRIMEAKENKTEVRSMVNMGIKESKLPKNLDIEYIHALPEEVGVYYMHDTEGKVVYVGKSIDIKKRIASHFAEQTSKAARLQQLVHEITFELTGSELIALLLESHEIKRIRPPVNRAQRSRRFPWAIHYYYNDDGFICFDTIRVAAKDRAKYHLLSEFPKPGIAKGRLNMVLDNFELCARYCNVQKGNGACFNYHVGKCHGACAEKETREAYNLRAQEALESLTAIFKENFFILDKGRSDDELGVVLVKDGNYQGFGYIDANDNHDHDTLMDAIKFYEGNPETTRIIQSYLSKHSEVKVINI